MRTTCRECVSLVAVGIGRNDTVILHLRERNKEVAGISCTVERQAVGVAETGAEEVLHVVLDGHIGLDLLGVVVNSTIPECGTVESRTPGTVLIISLVTVPTHTKFVLHLGQAHYLLPLQATVVLDTQTFSLLLSTLGSNHNYTIGSAATIESGSGSTLKNGHTLHIIRVHHIGTVTKVVAVVKAITTDDGSIVQRHTVHYIERLVGT